MLTKLLLGLLAASLVSSGVLYVKGKWQAARDKKEIQELQSKAIEYQATIYKQEAEIKDLAAAKKIRERQTYVNQEIDLAVSSGDDAAMRRLFVDLGMLPPDAIRPATPGGKGGPGYKPGAPAGAATVH